MPYAMVDQVEQEYDRLVEADILYPVDHSHWATPVVNVSKADGSIRVCGDYKAVNQLIEDDPYKLPSIQDLFAKLAQEGTSPKVFSVLDLTGAFNQLLLDEEASKILVLNTHKGLLGTKRLTFGVKVAPAKFQECMDKILSGISKVFCYIDDILIATDSVEEHMAVLKEVLERLRKFNVKLNRRKCLFLKSQLRYLGHVLNAEGIRPLEDKVKAIQEAPRPKDVSELKSFLGMVNFYAKFVPNLSAMLHKLYALLGHSARWVWTKECDEAFQLAKNAIAGAQVLVHFDPSLPLILCVDASPYGIGALISHRMADGSEKPIAFASRTLSQAEKNYAQIEKEGLAIIFGIKKFHMYLFGRKEKFTLVTDHQPLTRIFGPKGNIPTLAAARMQRWALILSGYNYDIVYRSSSNNASADMLSRLPVGRASSATEDECYVFQSTTDVLPVTASEISMAVAKDCLLSKVYEYTLSGWPGFLGGDIGELNQYFVRRSELSIEDGCILWGRRVIIPEALRSRIMDELHACHPGMCRMKSLARSYVWWPCLNYDIEEAVRCCERCIEAQRSPKKVPLVLWPWATEAWQRIHVDYLEIQGQMFFLVVDAYSKWLEVFPMNGTSAKATIGVLRSLFARYGLPLRLVSDNGPQFIADEFKSFLQMNGVEHTLCPPYHPASNGQAEVCVQTFKRMFKKLPNSMQLDHRVYNVLFTYRNIPHSTTDKTPAELFLKRSPRTRLSLVKPNLQGKVEKKQQNSKFYRDGPNPVARHYDLYQKVRVRNIRGGKEKWIPGTIVGIKGPSTYTVKIPGNNSRFVHADHLIHDDGAYEGCPIKGDSGVAPMSGNEGKVTPMGGYEMIKVAPNLSDVIKVVPGERNGIKVVPKDKDDTKAAPRSPEYDSPCRSNPSNNVPPGDTPSTPGNVSTKTPISRSKSGASPTHASGAGTLRRSSRVIKSPDRLNLYVGY